MYPIYQIIGGHNCRRFTLLYGNLKSTTINLTKGPFRKMNIYSNTIIFLIIACKMLNRYPASCFTLNPFGNCCCQTSCKQRVL